MHTLCTWVYTNCLYTTYTKNMLIMKCKLHTNMHGPIHATISCNDLTILLKLLMAI